MAADLEDEFGAIDVIGVDDDELVAANHAVDKVLVNYIEYLLN